MILLIKFLTLSNWCIYSWYWNYLPTHLSFFSQNPAEILKLWIGLRQLGEDGIRQLLEGAIDRRVYLQERIDLSSFELISGPLHLIAISPIGFDEHQSSQWSFATRQTLLDKELMLSRPIYRNHHYLKAVLGNPHTQKAHLDELSKTLNKSLSGFSKWIYSHHEDVLSQSLLVPFLLQ